MEFPFRCERCKKKSNDVCVAPDAEVFLCRLCCNMYETLMDKELGLSEAAAEAMWDAFFDGRDIEIKATGDETD